MATAFASSSCSARLCQRAGAVRQPGTTAVVARPAAVRQQQLRSVQAFAAVEDDIIDLDAVKLQGPTTVAEEVEGDAQEFSLEELLAAAESTHYNNLAVADIEAAFLEGTADQEVASYLAGLQGEAEGLLMQAKGPGVQQATEAIAAAAAELEEAGDVPDAPVVAELGRRPLGSGPRDVLEPLSNDEALAARKVVKALKLRRAELEQELVPEDWDATTVDWFSNTREEGDVALPEYRLVFMWLDKTLACAIDQVYARGNSAPLTEYFMWPREDAWEELKLSLDAKPWVGDAETVSLLNRLTQVINFWTGQQQFDEQNNLVGEAVQPSIEEARAQFPDCSFVAAQNV